MQLLHGLTETRRYWILKEEGLDHKHSEEVAFEEVWNCRKTDCGMTHTHSLSLSLSLSLSP
jgi:hypothetical protein